MPKVCTYMKYACSVTCIKSSRMARLALAFPKLQLQTDRPSSTEESYSLASQKSACVLHTNMIHPFTYAHGYGVTVRFGGVTAAVLSVGRLTGLPVCLYAACSTDDMASQAYGTALHVGRSRCSCDVGVGNARPDLQSRVSCKAVHKKL
jgi:hypothetical protein